MKGFPTKHTKLEIPYRSIMHQSSHDICISLHKYVYRETSMIMFYVFMYVCVHVCLNVGRYA